MTGSIMVILENIFGVGGFLFGSVQRNDQGFSSIASVNGEWRTVVVEEERERL